MSARIIFADTQSIYADNTDLEKVWTKAGSQLYPPSLSSNGRAGGASIAPASLVSDAGIIKSFPQVSRIGIQFRMRMSSVQTHGYNCVFRAGPLSRMEDTKDVASVPNNEVVITNAMDLIGIRSWFGDLLMLRSVKNDNFLSNIELAGSLMPSEIQPGQLIHVEILADVSQQEAQVLVLIDGIQALSRTYDRGAGPDCDRFEYVGFLSAGNGPSIHFSDIVVYEPAAGDLVPLGPLQVDYIPASAAFTAPPVDADAVEIPSGGGQVFTPDLPASGEIVGAFLHTRTLPQVTENAYKMQAELKVGGLTLGELDTGIVSTRGPKITQAPLDLVEDFADLAGAQITAKSGSGS